MKACSIDECEKGGRMKRGFCNMHYARWRAHGDPLVTLTYSDPEEAFLARTEPIVGDPGCIIWTGTVNSRGYGRLRVNGRMVYAHRYSWERTNGPIPAGMEVDHICHNRSCVEISHLRLATRAQNTWNLSGVRKNGGGLPRGVTRDGRKYRAQVCHNGQNHYLGLHDTPEAASRAAQTERAILFGEYAGRA